MNQSLLAEAYRALEPFGGPENEALWRIAASARIYCGAEERPPGEPQQPRLLYVPGLEAKPWHDPMEHPDTAAVARRLEAVWTVVRDEYRQVPRERAAPYEPGVLSGLSGSWTSFDLRRKRRDAPIGDNCALVPETSAAVEELAPFLFPGGEAIFSLLGPRSHIPPHYDSANFKLTCHLPVVVPPGCGLRVQGEARPFEEGRCLLFDASFLHEAWNPSDEPRVCLVVDVWHPDLGAVEREALSAVHALVSADFYS